MPPHVINIRRAEDRRDVVHRAVQALVEGKIVAFPTETVYGIGACARSAEGIEQLTKAKGRTADSPLALAIKSVEEALDYVPKLDRLAERLARRCWPGPITLVVELPEKSEHAAPQGLIHQLPQSVQEAVASEGNVGLRVPANETVLEILRMLTGPIALTSANPAGEPEAKTAEEVVEKLGDKVALVLDDGPCRYGQASTVVKVTGNQLHCLREGVVSQSTLHRLSSMMILIVCTGNTCRSPMAEVIMQQLAAEKLNCSVEELEQKGVLITSAGIAAVASCAPSPEAVEVMRERDLDLSKHESQPITEKLIQHSDQIFTLTNGHLHALTRRWPECASRARTLRLDGGDINDPIGGSTSVYRECAEQITAALKEQLDNIDFS